MTDSLLPITATDVNTAQQTYNYTPPPSPPLMLRGRPVSEHTLIPTSWKIALVVGVAICAVAITFAILTTQGLFSPPSWVPTALKWGAGIQGSLLLLSIPFLIGYYNNEKNYLENSAKREMGSASPVTPLNATPADPVVPAPITPAPAPAAAPPVPEIWAERLQMTPVQHRVFYDLDQPDRPLPPSGVSPTAKQLPLFGQYRPGRASYEETPALVARLPASHIRKFPNQLQAMLGHQPNSECYFMVFDNTSRRLQGNKRNLAFHAMALPEYDRQHPDVPSSNVDHSVEVVDGHGLRTGLRIAMFDPQGINPVNGSYAIPVGAPREMLLYVHGQVNQAAALSPNTAEFEIDPTQPVSSAYFAATFRGKCVAVHALFINSRTPGSDGATLMHAVGQNSPAQFLAQLEGQARFDQVRQTFAPPPAQ
jgi:hypothetical protein